MMPTTQSSQSGKSSVGNPPAAPRLQPAQTKTGPIPNLVLPISSDKITPVHDLSSAERLFINDDTPCDLSMKPSELLAKAMATAKNSLKIDN
ncbi:hypothetical protein N9L24_01205 [Candidatus Marinamargulisbacteria bacterium]|nr:hypothetical protein [Candidatus Marinamargulisbacteria bacterium]